MTHEEMKNAEEALAKLLIQNHAGDIVAAGLKQLARRPVDRFVKWYQGRPAPATPAQVAAEAIHTAVPDPVLV